MLSSRPDFEKLGISQSKIFTVSCNDLINQEHIINVQLPILLERSKGSIKPVSYTHLDVYKRQLEYRIRIALDNQ